MRFRLWHRVAIRTQWKRWLGPLICALPYLASIIWLLFYSQPWIAFVLCVPALLIIVIGMITFILARLEFYGRIRRP